METHHIPEPGGLLYTLTRVSLCLSLQGVNRDVDGSVINCIVELAQVDQCSMTLAQLQAHPMGQPDNATDLESGLDLVHFQYSLNSVFSRVADAATDRLLYHRLESAARDAELSSVAANFAAKEADAAEAYETALAELKSVGTRGVQKESKRKFIPANNNLFDAVEARKNATRLAAVAKRSALKSARLAAKHAVIFFSRNVTFPIGSDC
jgi:hypothetical protein